MRGRRFLTVAVAALLAGPAFADSLTYVNDRFGTSISFPADLFDARMPPPDNGDGMTFTATDGGSLAVYAFNNALGHTPAGLIDDIAASGVELTYRRTGADWAVASGIEDGKVFYQRFEFGADDVIHAFLLKYPVAQKPLYDPHVAGIAATLEGP